MSKGYEDCLCCGAVVIEQAYCDDCLAAECEGECLVPFCDDCGETFSADDSSAGGWAENCECSLNEESDEENPE